MIEPRVAPAGVTAARVRWRRAWFPTPAMSASLSYFDSYRSPRLPQNLTQAQRDYFGSHTYERADRAGTFHTNWSGDRQEHLLGRPE